MTHNGTCNNVKGQKHRVLWDFHKPELEDDYVRFDGKCLVCLTEFQSTYQFIGNSIISKMSGIVLDFNYSILEPQFDHTIPLQQESEGKI